MFIELDIQNFICNMRELGREGGSRVTLLLSVTTWREILPDNFWKNQRKWPLDAPGEFQVGHQEEFLHRRSGQALELAAQERGGVTIPESSRNDCTWHLVLQSSCHDGVSSKVDMMILEMFSNLNNSMIQGLGRPSTKCRGLSLRRSC